ERILVAPSSHPLAGRADLRLADLVPHELILEPRGTAFRDELDQAARAAGVDLHPLAEVDGMTLVASLAFSGFGPAILPTTATLDEPEGDWVSIPVVDLHHRAVGLARRRSGRLAAPARALRDIVVELIAREAPRHQGVEIVV